MTITVHGPEGLKIEFPDDTPDETVDQVMTHAYNNRGKSSANNVGLLETFGRAAADTGTFGLANGMLDRDRLKLAREQNPWTAFAGDVAGGIGQTAALIAAPAVTGPTMVARGANFVRSALTPNLAANTTGALVQTGAKVGGAQGVLHGIGDTITNPDKVSLADPVGSAVRVAQQATLEGGVGAAAGAVLTPAIHGIVRGANNLYHRMLPGVDQAADDFANPAGAATSQLQRAMDYDGVSPAAISDQINVQAPASSTMTRAEARVIADRIAQGEAPADVAASAGHRLDHVMDIANQDQAIRAQFDNLNALEAIKSGRLRPSTRMPEEVPVMPPGQMTQEMADLIADRLARGESPALVADRMRNQITDPADVQAIAGQSLAIASRVNIQRADNVIARQAIEMRPEVMTATNTERVARDAARSEGRGADEAREAFTIRRDEMGQQVADRVEFALGAQDRVGDQARLRTRLDIAGDDYNTAAERAPMVNVPSFGGMETNTVFKRALQYAADREQVRNDGAGRPIWAPADGTTTSEGRQYLTPREIIDVHHNLVKNSKAKVGGDPTEALTAGELKKWFSKTADRLLEPHQELRTSYARIKGIMDATEAGADLPILTGGRNHPSLTFFQTSKQRVRETDLQLRRDTARYNASMANFQTGKIATRPSRGDLARAEAQNRNAREVVREFQKAWGETIADSVYRAPNGNPSGVINQLLSAEGKARLLTVLGREAGTNVISALYNVKLQNGLGNTLYGNSDTAYNAARMGRANSPINAGAALVHGRLGDASQHLVDMVAGQRIQQRNDAINNLMSRQGIGDLRTIFDGLAVNRQQAQRMDPASRNPGITYGNPIASRWAGEDIKEGQDGRR